MPEPQWLTFTPDAENMENVSRFGFNPGQTLCNVAQSRLLTRAPGRDR